VGTNILHPDILIVSSASDAHVRAVLSYLPHDVLPLICDFSQFSSTFGATFSLTPESSEPHDTVLFSKDGQRYSLSKVSSVWWRRPQPFLPQSRFDIQVDDYLRGEFSAFWGGILSSLPPHVRWYNYFDANKLASRKLYQLAAARDCGFTIPRTLVTSSPEEAKCFVESNPRVAFKSFSGTDTVWRPTRLFQKEMIEHIGKVSVSPVVFQEYVDGGRDFRITVIDEHIEAVAFDIDNSRYRFDVRMDTRTPRVRTSIPNDVANKLNAFMRKCGLRYGAFDLRERRDGEFVFFEVNPAGQFLYLDITAGTKLSEVMAQALAAHNENSSRLIAEDDSVAEDSIKVDFDVSEPFALSVPHLKEHLR
jgi:hypothetical protein